MTLAIALAVTDELRPRVEWVLEALLATADTRWRLTAADADLGVGVPGSRLTLPHDPAAWAATPAPPAVDWSGEAPTGDVLALAWWWLARVEELELNSGPGTRDPHDRFRFAASALAPRPHGGLLPAAPVDAIAGRLRAAIGLPAAVYPGGAPFAIALTHDIDVVQRWTRAGIRQALGDGRRGLRARSASAVGRSTVDLLSVPLWRLRRSDPCQVATAVARLEARYGATSTSYLLADHRAPEDGPGAPYRRGVARYAREASAGGGVLGLHASYTTDPDARAIARERAALAALCGGPPPDNRYHYLHHRPELSWPALEAAGLTTDASLGFAEQPGFRSGFSAPYRAWDHARNRALELVIVPLALMDASLEDRYAAIAPDSADAQELIDRLLAHGRASASGFSVLWHNDKLGGGAARPWLRLYERLLSGGRDAGALMTDTGTLARYWRERVAAQRGA